MPIKKKILIVEDDSTLRKSLAQLLEKAGYSATEAGDGDVGQFMSLLSNYDLLISDINMPEVDGITMTKFIKSKLPVPVILISGLDRTEIEKKIAGTEIEIFLTKPFKTEELLNAVKNALGKNA